MSSILLKHLFLNEKSSSKGSISLKLVIKCLGKPVYKERRRQVSLFEFFMESSIFKLSTNVYFFSTLKLLLYCGKAFIKSRNNLTDRNLS